MAIFKQAAAALTCPGSQGGRSPPFFLAEAGSITTTNRSGQGTASFQGRDFSIRGELADLNL